jgi:hypothetical protein
VRRFINNVNTRISFFTIISIDLSRIGKIVMAKFISASSQTFPASDFPNQPSLHAAVERSFVAAFHRRLIRRINLVPVCDISTDLRAAHGKP